MHYSYMTSLFINFFRNILQCGNISSWLFHVSAQITAKSYVIHSNHSFCRCNN